MFTWICPRCGREVPPSYTECPTCANAGQTPAAVGAAAIPPAYAPPPPAAYAAPPPQQQPSFLDLVQEPPAPAVFPAPPPPPAQPVYYSQPAAPAYQPPPPAYQPPPPAYQPPPPAYEPPLPPRPPSATAPASFLGLGQSSPARAAAAPAQQSVPTEVAAPRRGLPTWLLTIVFAAAFAGIVGGIYWLVGGGHASNAKPAASAATPAANPNAAANPYQKYVEVSGVRFIENTKTKKPDVKFVVTNHSGADITGLAGTVTVFGGAKNSPRETEGSFQFTTNVGAWESKDVTAPFDTQKEMIELPDWEFVSAAVQITAPTQ